MTPEQKVHVAAIVSSELWAEHLVPFLKARREIVLETLAQAYGDLTEVRWKQGESSILAEILRLPDDLKREDKPKEEEKKNAGRARSEQPATRTIIDHHGRRPER